MERAKGESETAETFRSVSGRLLEVVSRTRQLASQKLRDFRSFAGALVTGCSGHATQQTIRVSRDIFARSRITFPRARRRGLRGKQTEADKVKLPTKRSALGIQSFTGQGQGMTTAAK